MSISLLFVVKNELPLSEDDELALFPAMPAVVHCIWKLSSFATKEIPMASFRDLRHLKITNKCKWMNIEF